MDKVLLPPGDVYDKKCGDIFLTTNGNVVFHCTLCEDKFSSFHNYFDHVYKRHYTPISEKKKTVDHLHAIMGFGVKSKSSEPKITNTTETEEVSIETEILDVKNTESNVELVNEKQFDDEDIAVSMEYQPVESSDEISTDENNIQEDDTEHDKILKVKASRTRKRKLNEEATELHKCPHCDYTSKHKRYIIDHVKRHLDIKKHKCTECDKAFFKKYELISHTRTHTGERPYLCPDCGRGFATSSMLLEHVKRHKNIRDKECEICKMKFYNAKELRIHKAVHSDARPFGCTICKKAFKTRLSLKSHMKIHANKREYLCNFCKATFNQSSGLYSHINNKHNFSTETTELVAENTELATNFTWF